MGPFNISHAVGLSIGTHLLVLGFFPVLSLSVAKEENIEPVRLEIIEKSRSAPKIKKVPVVHQKPIPVIRKKLVTVARPKTVTATRQKPVTVVSSVERVSAPVVVAAVSKTTVPQINSAPRVASLVANEQIPIHSPRLRRSPLSPVGMPAVNNSTATTAKIIGGVVREDYPTLPFTPMARAVRELAPAMTEEERNGLWKDYTHAVRNRVARRKDYPTASRRKNQQGEVILSFRLSQDGKVLDLSLESSSGHESLDQAAMKAVRDASPYPVIPRKLNKKNALLKIPILFALR